MAKTVIEPSMEASMAKLVPHLDGIIERKTSVGNISLTPSKIVTNTEACYVASVPSELLETVFQYCELEWDGNTPALIVALRPNRRLYQEALRLFYKRSTYFVSKTNRQSTASIEVSVLQSIFKLDITMK
jgi:hypothetical protein